LTFLVLIGGQRADQEQRPVGERAARQRLHVPGRHAARDQAGELNAHLHRAVGLLAGAGVDERIDDEIARAAAEGRLRVLDQPFAGAGDRRRRRARRPAAAAPPARPAAGWRRRRGLLRRGRRLAGRRGRAAGGEQGEDRDAAGERRKARGLRRHVDCSASGWSRGGREL
jgi:hypothetical protein